MSRLRPLRRPTAKGVSSGTLVVLALALGQWLDTQLPQAPDANRPYEVEGQVGERVDLRSGHLEVTSVNGATVVDLQSSLRRSPGVFTVVELTWTPLGESSSLEYAALRDNRGRELPFGSLYGRNVLDCRGTVTGVPVRCLAVVEADPDTLAGASLALATAPDDLRWDSMAVVDLGIDDADVDRWREQDEPLPAPATGIAPGGGR
ncbi:hypothetical protein IEQ44_00530 [Nocardioides sp. Y6]|uniref:Uncharacterized protein n=1 Tax=Nocardioides malaquae TaxID=2773426 RepID=A0ABR9RP16_9ACTN|nr:hypothetical protein [Nocardioides malaquae]MBE7323135.1 hypothetical protein [Nocardioides malaquae]